MKKILVAALGLGLIGTGQYVSITSPAAAQSVAAEETMTFAIEHMTCALCPITVKRAMEGVDGVRSVEVDFDAKTATVVFDTATTSAETISAASTQAGYPARKKG
ncbi:heavy-metal-associated domain-containing protein [Phaeobacter gallaeciensis]|uniref:heavy-metal-associated domain-containing protein n=1 Tax=Phaeobacter gallaeciensis TaxID=60890 RepID=UPI00237F6331|nr:cation transporter [Phaeobacter gallaeciensis]MDE4099710.1 cation transporter [Phaeobacter gallaeciensis]MDE4108555.1 cation transporter [Phaeobacter gallaeciensis]MDE4110429.1 cation transporter [Phaeobacter gallaeciensis]MDE4117351.1 cation transporter [Phaeobacter gallaeciensis]MDE4121824.1 cation transporter [Phaeobacter gallaeciensis]